MSSFVVPGANPSLNLAVVFGNNSLVTTSLTVLPKEFASVDFNLLLGSSVKADACFTLLSSGSHEVRFYLTVDDVKVNSVDFINSTQSGYLTLSITGFVPYLSSGPHNLKLWALTNAPLGAVGCSNVSINGIANLI
jgi:hypothetical protein